MARTKTTIGADRVRGTALAEQPATWRYVYRLCRRPDLRPGSFYLPADRRCVRTPGRVLGAAVGPRLRG